MAASQDPKAQILTEDGLENLVANLGNEMDKRFHTRYVNSKQLSTGSDHAELDSMYQTDWLAAKVVDIIPDDMTREWRSFIGDIKPETVKILKDEEDRLNLVGAFNKAHKWSRLYGTAFIIMNVDDGMTPDKPLKIEAIKKGGLKHIKVLDRHQLHHSDIVNTDPMSLTFGMPEMYRFNENSAQIHFSRVIRFDAVELPYELFRQNDYWSESVLDRLYEALINFSTTASGSASMVYETNVDIIKVDGLMAYLQTEKGENLLRRRFALAKLLKSFNNMLLLDSKEEHTTKTNTFAGLPDLLDRFAQHLSAATDIPATRLLGTSASGMNATGEGDLKNYYDMIRSQQRRVYRPLLDYFDLIMAKSLGIGEDADLSYEFNSLFQMTDMEVADLQLKRAQRDQVYLVNGIVTEAIVAKELKQDDTYTNITDDYIEELEEAIANGDFTDPLIAEVSGEEQEGAEGAGNESTKEPGSIIP